MRTCLLALLLIGAACGPADHARLDAPLSLAVGEVYAGTSLVSFTIAGPEHKWRREFRVPITTAKFELSTHASSATLESLDLALPDSRTPAELYPPDGLALRDLSVGVRRPVQLDVIERDDDHLALGKMAPLALHWSLGLFDGNTHRLADIETPPVELRVAVSKQDDMLTGQVAASCMGVCWQLDGVFSFEDITLALDAELLPR